MTIVEERKRAWGAMELHGRFAACLASPHVDALASTEWLRSLGFIAQTEGFICVIEGQVVSTRAYQLHMMKLDFKTIAGYANSSWRPSNTL